MLTVSSQRGKSPARCGSFFVGIGLALCRTKIVDAKALSASVFLFMLNPSLLPLFSHEPCSKNLEKKSSLSKITQHIRGRVWARIWVNAFSKNKKSKLVELSTISCSFVTLTSSRAKHPIYLGPSAPVILPRPQPKQGTKAHLQQVDLSTVGSGLPHRVPHTSTRETLLSAFLLLPRPRSPGWLRRHPGEGTPVSLQELQQLERAPNRWAFPP